MSTDERHLLIMVERLPDEIAQVYSRTKHKKPSQHRNSFKHRKLKDKGGDHGESDGEVLSPAARESRKPTTVSPSRLPMSLPMYSRSISLPLTREEKTEACNQSLKVKVKVEPRVKVKIKSNKRGGSHESNKVLRKIKIRRISNDVLPPSTPETDANPDVKALFTKDDEEGSSKEPSEKYEIVSSSGKVTNVHEESGAASEESGAASVFEQTTVTKGNVEAWLRGHVGESSEGVKENTNSFSEESVFKETNTSDESSVNQDTESYNSDHEEELVESDGTQRTEIDAADCTSSDTEIDEAEQCQPEVASFVDVNTAASMSDEESSHSDMLRECSTALEDIVSEVCAKKNLPVEEDGDSSDNNCAEDMATEAGLRDSPSPSVEMKDTSAQPSETIEEAIIAEVLDDSDELCVVEQNQAVLPIDVIDITDDTVVLTSLVGESQPCARTDVPPNSSASDPNSGKTSRAVTVVDLTSDDVDCYVVSPENCNDETANPEMTTAPEVTVSPKATTPEMTGAAEVTASTGMTGVCMAAAKELDQFANETISESWDVEAESILECAGEYLGHLEKCLTSLDLMQEAMKSMLVTSLQKKGHVLKQIFVLLKKLLRHPEQLNRVQSIESGFCVLLGIETSLKMLPGSQIPGLEEKEPNNATKALIQRLSIAVNDDHARVPVKTTSIAQEVPSVEHRLPQRANSANECSMNAVNARNLQPVVQRQIHHGQPVLRQGSDPNVSTLLKELKQIASPSSSSNTTVSREKAVTVEAKQVQPSRQATVASTSVAASTLLSVTSASLGRQISVLPVATAGCSGKVIALPANVTLLPATTSVSAATSSATTTNTTSVVGGAKAVSEVSPSRASPHSILQKLQQNLGLTVRPVQQKEKLDKDSTAAYGSPSQKNIPTDVATSSSETAVSRNSVITIPSGLSITSAPTRVSTADKIANKTSEQVAVIELGKAAASVAPVSVQTTTLQNARWPQHQQNVQLGVVVPGLRVVQAPSFQGRAVAIPPPPPLQWCSSTVTVGRPVGVNVWRPHVAVPPFPWGGFAPQDPRLVAGAHPSGQRVLPGQACACTAGVYTISRPQPSNIICWTVHA
ncbi:hypothetical protein HPB51_009163 [Rhipicephalus microplus]|uniref:Uncharacterized protein n=1 Tax=Rhipicephalus microplus TaxID=6941 RepID=A0A9J6EZU6_RHIMP|nr:hypothetical protein HPB51_009163 [Rhipicephalus microplus]